MVRIVFVGGGTGGHFYPLIAIAERVSATARANKLVAPEFYYMGPDPHDKGALFATGITFVRVPAGKRRRYFSVHNFIDFWKTFGGFFVALWKLFSLYPDVVMSKGGYTSVPVVLAAFLLRIPIVVHESDSKPGRANVLAARFARYIGVGYQETLEQFPKEKTEYVGIPVRAKLLGATSGSRKALGIQSDKPLILVLGGSQGAERVNDLIVSALDELLPLYVILHQSGEKNVDVVKESSNALIASKNLLSDYYVQGFLDAPTLHGALNTASIVVSRAGSSTIHEIALHGKPSILIPIPEDISHDQRSNAYAYARAGAASVIEERNLTSHLLVSEINRILGDRALSEKMTTAASAFAPKDAAEKMAEVLVGIGYEHGS